MNVSLPAQTAAVTVLFPLSALQVFFMQDFLGGRIAMAAACLYPESIDCLHLTGVATEDQRAVKMLATAWKVISK
jgi:hypothetical protein